MKPTIKVIRTSLGMTQAELAKELGVSPATVVSWEKGNTDISGKALIKLSQMAGIHAEEISI